MLQSERGKQMILAIVVAILGVIGVALLLRPWPFFLPPEESNSYRDRNVAVEFVKWVERQALARGLSVRGVARPVPLECKKCGKSSNYFVYPAEVCERCWRATLKPVSASAKEHRP
jgi:hypothetical protein